MQRAFYLVYSCVWLLALGGGAALAQSGTYRPSTRPANPAHLGAVSHLRKDARWRSNPRQIALFR